MVKTEITILDYKDTSSTRTTFETSHGKMSAFKNEGDTLIEDLKSHTNRLISVKILTTVKDDKTYLNIRKFYGAVAKQKTEPEGVEVISPQKFTRPEIIDDRERLSKVITHSNGRKEYDKDPVGLAIEVFCAIKDGTEGTMKHACDLVKQAQEAFS